MIRQYPYYASEGTQWLVGCPSNDFMITNKNPDTIGYQAYPETNLVKNPSSLGGRWFSKRKTKKSRKTKKTKKTRKSYNSKTRKTKKTKTRKIKKSMFGQNVMTSRPRLVSPNSMTTQDSFVF